MSQNATVNVDIKLGVNKFHVDEGHPHIILAANPDINEFRKLMKACPAGLYKQDDAGNIHFDSAGCLEWHLSGAVRQHYSQTVAISRRHLRY
jgi:ferredoxin like protein